MIVQVIGVSQDVSFADDSITNVVTLRLPNGQPVQAVVTEAGLQQILAAKHGAPPPQAAPPPPAPPAPPPAREPPVEDHTFGGDYADEGDDVDPPGWVPPQHGHEDLPDSQRAGGLDVDDVLEGGLDVLEDT